MISESSGMLTGRVVRILEPLGDTAVCELCTDERHNKPIVGLDIIRNVKSAGDATTWAGGEILDPDTGKSYALKLQLLAGGQMLKVHGYIGPFYRNQYWQRIPDAASNSH